MKVLCCLRYARAPYRYRIIFGRVFISICSLPLQVPFRRLGRALERRPELRRGDTGRPGRLEPPGRHRLPPIHPPQPPSTLFASTGRQGDYDVSQAFQTLVMINKGLAGTRTGMASRARVLGTQGGKIGVAISPAASVTPGALRPAETRLRVSASCTYSTDLLIWDVWTV